MENPSIIITGKNGQLGNELAELTGSFPSLHFVFIGHAECDITNSADVRKIFETYKPAWFINTAAYTAVDKAESEQQQAYAANAEAIGTIAVLCNEYHTKLIHVSTDYVFDGKGNKPYTEDDITDPVNYYGYSKWVGEQLALQNNASTIIIRTSWVYSKYGNNFVKTMLRLMKDRSELNVVSDQFGSPTWAKDLAEAILGIVHDTNSFEENFKPGIYHYSNEGIISWYDFAVAIQILKGLACKVNPITTDQYPTPARRPSWSVMSKEKIRSAFHLSIPEWKQSLEKCLAQL